MHVGCIKIQYMNNNLHNYENIVEHFGTKICQRPVEVMHWRVCYIIGAN